jgi:hypothetical protein
MRHEEDRDMRDSEVGVDLGDLPGWDDIPVVHDAATLLAEGFFPAVVGGLKFAGIQPSRYKPEGQPTLYVGVVVLANGIRATRWQAYNNTLNQKGNLYELVIACLGKAFPRTKDGGFDPRMLVGKAFIAEVVHVDRGGRLFWNIDKVARLPAGMAAPVLDEPLTPPEWVLAKLSNRLDKPAVIKGANTAVNTVVNSEVSTVANTAANTAVNVSKSEGDGVEEWAKIGFCKPDDGDEGSDFDGAEVADVTEG